MTDHSVAHVLTEQDLDILIEAVEAWENKDLAGDMMFDLITSSLTDRKDPAAKAQLEEERNERIRTKEQQRRRRKEQSILLRAKLIQMLDAQRANSFAVEAFRKERPS